MDHVEPVALHPELALDYDNCRAAHLSCNSSRGTGQNDNQDRNSRAW